MFLFAGSMLGYCFSSDYDSLVAVIRNLTDDQKQEIAKKVQELVGSASLEALTNFIGVQVRKPAGANICHKVVKD
jgi:hypothetical protein